ncbi:MAG: tetratricopeptide repeat protein [Rhodospirillales bacterium]|nr:tetratricopeptide repeat protein [Rhodospirillales bacterium]
MRSRSTGAPWRSTPAGRPTGRWKTTPQRSRPIRSRRSPSSVVACCWWHANRAIEDSDKVLVIEPDNVEILVSRGDAFGQLGDLGRAMADLNRAVALAPDKPTVLLARGQVESRRGDLAVEATLAATRWGAAAFLQGHGRPS